MLRGLDIELDITPDVNLDVGLDMTRILKVGNAPAAYEGIERNNVNIVC